MAIPHKFDATEHHEAGLNATSRKALASLRLEGIVPSAESLADMKLVDAGKMSIQEFRSRSLARAKS
jgi:hypothetical protein